MEPPLAAERPDGQTFLMRTGLAQIVIGGTIALVFIACGASPASPAADDLDARPPAAASSAPTAPSAAAADDNTPAARPKTPKPKFAGFDFELSEGTFWEYRWEAKSSFFAARGSSSDSDSGTFKVTLGAQKEIDGVVAYEVKVTGKHQVDDEDRSFAPRWRYIGMADDKILVSVDGRSMVVLFDAGAGEWPDSGFFTTRMKAETLHKARSGTMTGPVTDLAGSQGRSSCCGKSLYRQGPVQNARVRRNRLWERVARLQRAGDVQGRDWPRRLFIQL